MEMERARAAKYRIVFIQMATDETVASFFLQINLCTSAKSLILTFRRITHSPSPVVLFNVLFFIFCPVDTFFFLDYLCR